MKQTLKLLGKRIAKLRAQRGLTQEKLSELVDYSPNHISKLESARTKPSFELLYAIAKALNVEMMELFNFEEYRELDYVKKEFFAILKEGNPEKISVAYKIFQALDM